jgi:nucleoside-diphosphate kinase
MSSGPVLPILLEREQAIQTLRDLMGATDPQKAAPGTIRREYGESIERNAIHGSDAPETAAFEIPFFFNQLEVSGTDR